MESLIAVINQLQDVFNTRDKRRETSKISENMESLIAVINKLQDVFNTVGSESIQLPQIVVMGAQSAGKSSVIEALVGGSFLPRGSGIVTRRPLILQLITCPLDDVKYRSYDKGTIKLEKWGEFLHKDKVFADFDEIREEIEDETDRVAGANKGIVPKPINLKIYSPDVVNLTLVDLPGITKVPVGDQPEDIEKQIKELVMDYIENPNSIILAVQAANMDLATSEALKIAKNTDPDGVRTLAVLTKLDLMDEGTDATDVLTGSVIPVKLGIIGVLNRSQKDINDKKIMEDQLEKESQFLAEKYPALASKNGTPYLAKTLSRLLMNHIHDRLPDLRQRVLLRSSDIQERLRLYGKEIVDKDQTLVHILTQFSKSYIATIEGVKPGVEGSSGKTLVYQIIHEKFEKSLSQIKPCLNVSVKSILESLSEASGPRPTLFDDPSFDFPFEDNVKKQVSLLEIPSLACVDEVHKEMVRNIRNCGSSIHQELERFPKLQKKIFDVVSKLLREKTEDAKKNVSDLIRMEIAYVNKKHPDFDKEDARIIDLSIIGDDSLKQSTIMNKIKELQRRGSTLFDEEEKKQCLILERLVSKYYDIIRKSIQDSVPKAVVFYLVNSTRDQVSHELLKHLYKSSSAEEVLSESDHISKGRKHCKEMLDALLIANQIIGEVSDDAEGLEDDTSTAY